MPFERELAVASELARCAGEQILRHFRTDLAVERKAGNEPVTLADSESEAVILEGLGREFPDDGVLSEEGAGSVRSRSGRIWVVDPLDGTQDFIQGLEGFSVMIGLLEESRPVLGVVYEPTTGRTFRGSTGSSAEMLENGHAQPLCTSSVVESASLRLVVSNSHRNARVDAVKELLGIVNETRLGSVGLKISLVARGLCDLYVHPSGHCKLWDTCAPEAVIAAAGGRMSDLHGAPLRYDLGELRQTRGLVASNGPCHDEVLRRIAPLFPPPA